jgi:hypothetical protein
MKPRIQCVVNAGFQCVRQRPIWPAGERELFMRIVPNRVTGRRIQSAG